MSDQGGGPDQLDPALTRLEDGPLFRFADWPVSAVPLAAAGVYTIWRSGEHIYVGMAGRGLSAGDIAARSEHGRKTGLWSRLESHASGRRSGDQFCVYVSDRLVLPGLTAEQIAQIAAGGLALDLLVRQWIRSELSFRFATTPDGPSALELERRIQAGALRAGKPFLNPL